MQAYLLGDAWTTGPRLVASPAIKAELERRRGAEILDAFLELSVALRRFEIVSHLRDRVESLGAERSLELEEKTRAGLRVYEFGESAQVLNNAVDATVLFLDLRGFTRTSEGHISEGDLTRELYARVRRLRADRGALRRHRRQVPGRRHDGHLGHQAGRPARPALRAAHGRAVPGVAAAEARVRAYLLHDGRRDPLRARVPRALHREPRRAALDGDRAQREPGGPAVLRGQARDRGGRGPGHADGAPAEGAARGQRRRPRARSSTRASHSRATRCRSSRRTWRSPTARAAPWSTRTRRSAGGS